MKLAKKPVSDIPMPSTEKYDQVLNEIAQNPDAKVDIEMIKNKLTKLKEEVELLNNWINYKNIILILKKWFLLQKIILKNFEYNNLICKNNKILILWTTQ